MSEKLELTESSGNVFKDAGFSEQEAKNLQLRLEAAIRETKEEVGVTIVPKFLNMVVVKSPEDCAKGIPWNQIGLFFYANQWVGELVNAEPHKHSKMEFFDIRNLPRNSLPVTQKGIELYLNRQNYAEIGSLAGIQRTF